MEMRMNSVVQTGRLDMDPISFEGEVYFTIRSSETEAPFKCVCSDKTAENTLRYLRQGDEINIEGELQNREFKTGSVTLIFAKFISYGRKLTTLRSG